MAYRSFDTGSYGGTRTWGNRPDDLDADGNPIAGTSGEARDVDRYREMAKPSEGNLRGPVADSSDMRGSRALSMSALDTLRRRAEGQETPAQRLAMAQTQGAVNAVQSGAAGIRGGAAARAAAARGAQTMGARVSAMGAQDLQALKAREQADATGQFFGASSAQRGRDLGVAGTNLGLEMGQRGANDQNEGFYEGLGFDTQKAGLDAMLGRGATDIAASNAARGQAIAAEQAGNAKIDRSLNAVTAAGQGAINAYGMTQGDPTPQRPGIIRENPYGRPYP